MPGFLVYRSQSRVGFFHQTDNLTVTDFNKLSLVSLVAGLGCLAITTLRSRGTTLTAPLCWAGVSFIAMFVATIETQTVQVIKNIMTLVNEEPTTYMAMRFLAAATTFLPMMALLGAKRPQHIAWQLIVVTLWLTLVWPAIESLARDREFALNEQPLRSGFVAVLLIVQWSNWLPTRYAPAVTLLTAAQVLLVWPQLPWVGELTAEQRQSLWNGGAIVLGLVPFAIWWCDRRGFRHSAKMLPDERLWRAFRDAFGVVWGLRVQERVNEVARLQHWPVELDWAGLVPRADNTSSAAKTLPAPIAPIPSEFSPAQRAAIDQAWRTILRRFVSVSWIETRLGRRLAAGELAE